MAIRTRHVNLHPGRQGNTAGSTHQEAQPRGLQVPEGDRRSTSNASPLSDGGWSRFAGSPGTRRRTGGLVPVRKARPCRPRLPLAGIRPAAGRAGVASCGGAVI
jgi:hypothetical protein